MRRAAVLALAAWLAWPAAAAADASADLAALARDAYQAELDLWPFLETYRQGAGPRQGKLEIAFSREHQERVRAVHRRTLARLDSIPLAQLNETDQLTHRLLAYEARMETEEIGLPLRAHSLLSQSWGGLASHAIFLMGIQPLRNESDFEAWHSRLRRFSQSVDAARPYLDAASKSGITTPAVLVRAAIAQWETLVPADGDETKSALWKALEKLPPDTEPAVRQRIEAAYRALLRDEVVPSMRTFLAYARDEYLPRARTTAGFGAIRGGPAMYRFLVRKHTTTSLTPDEIHELGLKEVRRIQTQLVMVASQAGFKGEMKDFGGWIGSRPENYPFNTAEEVLEHLRMLHTTRILPHMPTLFSRVPKAAFEIRLTEPELAPTASATYTRPSDDGTRPGAFRIPIVDPKKRSLYGLRSLLAHEGMPGHHFDHGFAAELAVPEFRRNFRTVAFGEGWGLYAESLGHAINLYDEPLSLMGRYAGELFRAARLVVDTGLHTRGWTRERAIRYLIEEGGSAEPGATIEIQRYMANPGQALGYKVGELTILELRAEAERRLGARFDVRAFHDALLGQGHMPLDMLRERMRRWIDAGAR